MRVRAVAATLLLLAIPAAAEESAPASSLAATADAVVAAVQAKDDVALAAVAEAEDPDPWEVADLLLARGEAAAARALATASPRVDLANLPAWVAAHAKDAARAPERDLRARVDAARAAREAGRPAEAVAALASREGPRETVLGAVVLRERALASEAAGDPAGAAAAYAAAGRAAEEIGWIALASDAWLQAGRVAHGRAEYEPALAAFRRSLAAFEAREVPIAIAGLEGNVGAVLRVLGRPDEALACHERALAIRTAIDDRDGIAWTLEALAALHADRGDLARGIEGLERAARIRHELEQSTEEGRVHVALARARLEQGDYEEAKAGAQRALEHLAGDGREVDRASALGVLASVHAARGETRTALGVAREALATCERADDRTATAGALGTLGEIHVLRGEYLEALEAHARALEIAEATGHAIGRGTSLAHQGMVQVRLGDYRRALMLLRQSAQAFDAMGYRAGLAPVLGEIGSLERLLGRYADALRHVEESRRLFESMGNRAGIARAIQCTSNVYFALGDLTRAQELEEDALRRYEALGRRGDAATSLTNLGAFHSLLEDYPSAIADLTRARDILEELDDRPTLGQMLVNLADVRVRSGSPAEALPLLERAREIATAMRNRPLGAATILTLGEAQRALGRPVDALASFQRAESEAERLSSPEILVRALVGIGQSQLDVGEPALALEAARRAVRTAQSLSFGHGEEQGPAARAQVADVYEVGARAATALQDAAALAYFLERGRAGSLLESLGGRAAFESARLPDELREAEARARAGEASAFRAYADALEAADTPTIRSAAARLEAARGSVLDVVSRIRRARSAEADLLYPTTATLDEMKAGLPAGHALVLYAFTPPDAVALVVTRERDRIVPLGTSAEVEAACRSLDVADRHTSADEAVDRLHRLVVKPLGLDGTTTTVLVSPDGALSYAPFGLLLAGRSVAFVPSGTTYGTLAPDAARHGEGVLALADPAYAPLRSSGPAAGPGVLDMSGPLLAQASRRGHRLVQLPGTRREAQAVADILLLGPDATEAGLRAKLAGHPRRWRSIHLACHGLVDSERPLLSALAVTPSGDDDGFLTAADVLGMSLPTDLAVLSACETGRGRIVRGEGIVGLARAFMLAGAPRVLVSLWKVDDEATQALMTAFYAAWNPKDGSPPVGPAEALRRAQAHVASRPAWKHPFYWAAWSLWGLPD